MEVREPLVLTGEDFVHGRPVNVTGCTLVLAHANLVGIVPGENDDHSDARELLEMTLDIAEDFPEIQVALLNCVTHADTAERLRVYVSEYGTQCAALIFAAGRDPHFVAAGGGETPVSLRQWLLGISLAWACRPATSREEICVRLAYDLAQPPEVACPDPRWDDPEIRAMAVLAVRETLLPLYEDWVPGFVEGDLG